MRMRSGSNSSSLRWEMHGCAFWCETEKIGLKTMEGPTSQGSIRIVKDPGNRPGEDSGATGGLKVSRNAVSPFNDFTVRDIATPGQSGRR
jgi:hypothetical protein